MKDQFIPLDKEEKDLIDSFENSEFIEIHDQKEERKKAQQAARNTLNKVKNINIRLSFKDIQKLKVKAVETGIPYQTLAASVLHQYAEEKIEVKI